MTKFLRLVFATCLASTLHFYAAAQSVSINTDGSTAHASALLDVKSTTKGVLVPRMNKTERNAIASPATGLMVFQNAPDSVGFYYYDGTTWLWLATANSSVGWLTTGNNGTDSAVNFLGTLDDKPLMLRQNNLWMGQLNTKMHNYFLGGGSGFNNTAQQNSAYGDSALFNNTTGTGNTAMGYRSMVGSGPITGGINVAVGNNTLSSITTGSQNVAIGDNAITSMKTGGTNIGIGPGAMEQATKGNSNIALGLWSQRGNDSASYNIGIGQSSLYYNDSARNIGIGIQALAYSDRNNIVGIGYQAGYLNNYLQTNSALGVENTYIGFQSGYYANTGSKNVAIGNHALLGQGYFNGDDPTNIYYKRNVAIGDSAMTVSYGSDNVAIGYKTLSKSTFTGQHVAVGSRALNNTTASYPNTAVGYSSQDSVSTGAANTSLGSYSLTKNKTGGNNTAIGNAAMMEAYNPAGLNYPYDNTAVGNDALRFTRYYGHVAMGAGALRNDTSGVYNTAVGYLSMYNNLSGTRNTALGTSALRLNTTSDGNTALGTNSMFNHKTGDYNTSIGYESMISDTAGSVNTAIGWRSLRFVEKGYENTALGVGALEFTDSAFANTAVGRGAMIGTFANTTNLTYNTALGWYAGAQMDSVNFAIAIGVQAGYNNRGKENTFIGYNSGYGGSGSNLTGIENVGVGTATLTFNNTGMSNTALGLGALYANRTGNGNVGIGTRALANAANYSYNIAIGDSAMYGNNADENMAIGTKSMWFNNTGSQNTAIGNYAMQLNSAGWSNVAVGHMALFNNNANANTAFGYAAGSANTTGSFNSLFGNNANVAGTALTNATAIGALAYVAQSNSMVLGSISGFNSATTTVNVGIGENAPDARLHVKRNGSSGGVFHASSSMIIEDNASSYLQFSNPNANETGFLSGNASTTIRSALIFRADSSVQLRTGGNSTRMTIDNNGYVGIGTTTPDSMLSVADKFLVGSSGTVQYDNSVPVMSYMFKSGTLNAGRMVVAHSPANPTWGLQYQDVTDQFNFVAGGVTKVAIELSSGQVGLGMNPTTQLELSLNSAQKPTSSTWFITSDERLKTIDGSYTKGLKDILKLNTITYHYNKGNQRKLPTDEIGYGFSAQAVQKIFPEAVRLGKDGYLSLDMHPILVSYINAFKEQQQQIDELKKQNDLLIKRIEKLENK